MDAGEQSYYANYRCANSSANSAPLCTHFGVEVAHAGENRGKIVRATRSIPCGSIAWVEDPLVGMSHLINARLSLGSCCARCLRPVGSVQQAWDRVNFVEAENEAAARAAEAKKKNKGKKKTKGKITKGKEADEAIEEEVPVVKESIQLPSTLPFFSTVPIDSPAATAAESLPLHTLHLPECAPIPCVRGCGEVYCSIQCRDLAFAQHHELLCSAMIPSADVAAAVTSSSPSSDSSSPSVVIDAAYTKMIKHATANNEIFLLAGQAVAQATLQALRSMREQPEVQSLLAIDSTAASSSSSSSPAELLPFAIRLHSVLVSLPASTSSGLRANVLTPCVSTSMIPFHRFCGSVWWNHVPLPPHIELDEEDEYRQTLCGVAEQALAKVGEVVESKLQQQACSTDLIAASPSPSWEELCASLELDEVWTLSFFGHILSSFELNNIGFHAPTSLGLAVGQIRQQLATSRSDDAVAQRQEVMDRLGGEQVWMEMQRRVSPRMDGNPHAGSVEGTGLFVVGCCMNHSCEPNITIRNKYASRAEGGEEEEEINERNDPQMFAQTCALLNRGYVVTSSDSIAASSSAPLHSPSTSSLPAVLLDRTAVFIALRDIAAGEELNISYIELLQMRDNSDAKEAADAEATTFEEVGLEARQQQLRAYEFTCQCNKCERESKLA